MNNGFVETGNQTVELDDEDPAILVTYILWLYEGKLNKETLPSDTIYGAVQRYLFKLYIFADKRGIGNLANDTITMLSSYWTKASVILIEVKPVILLLPDNSKLYDLILDSLVLELRDSGVDYDHPAVITQPKRFLIDLLRKSHELSRTFVEYRQCLQAVCHYHCHEGQSVLSEKECIRNTEAGYNMYHEHDRLKQSSWEGED